MPDAREPLSPQAGDATGLGNAATVTRDDYQARVTTLLVTAEVEATLALAAAHRAPGSVAWQGSVTTLVRFSTLI